MTKFWTDEDGDRVFTLLGVFHWCDYKGEALFTFGRYRFNFMDY